MSSSTHNPFSFDFSKWMEAFQTQSAHAETIMSTYRRNLDSMQEAQRHAMETLKTLSTAHGDYARQALEDCGQHVRNVLAAKTLEEKMKIHSDGVRAGAEKAMTHGKNIMIHLSKVQKETADHFNGHVKETVDAAKAAYGKATTNGGKKQ